MCKRITANSEKIRSTILNTFKDASQLSFKQIFEIISKKFNLKEGSIRKHLKALVDQENLKVSTKKGRFVYSINSVQQASFILKTVSDVDEMLVWVQKICPFLPNLSKCAKDILEYCFTEILNNAINHANAKQIKITLLTNYFRTSLIIQDDGIGIFKKIKDALNLKDEHQSLLELSKGKFTSDPKNHSGEGIFFSSRACDAFLILSGHLMYSLSENTSLDLLEDIDDKSISSGTTVGFCIKNNSSRSLNKIFKEYAPREEDNAFCRTVVPVKMLRYKDEGIVSRSQAKRLLARFDKFKYVVLDFEGIENIGQAFADEIFRVFRSSHTDINLSYKNADQEIKSMISHVMSTASDH